MDETIFLVIMICLLLLGIVFCLPLIIMGPKSPAWRAYMGAPNPIKLAELGYFWNEEKQKYEFIDVNKTQDKHNG